MVSATLLWQVLQSPGGPDRLRGESELTSLIAPRGDGVGARPRFVWSAAPGSPRYAFELFDPAGDRIVVLEASDTVAALPDSVALKPGQAYYWWVTTRWPDSRSSNSVSPRYGNSISARDITWNTATS